MLVKNIVHLTMHHTKKIKLNNFLKVFGKNILAKETNAKFETGLKKFGAMLGDNVEVGCNSVLNPGTVIGRNSNVYPTSMVRGVIPAGSIYKKQGEIAEKYEKSI